MLKKTGRWLALLYMAYLGLSVLVILPLLNYLPGKFVREQLGRELHTELVFFNPFAIAVVASGVAIPERNGEAFSALDRAEVNLSLESLWRRGLVFDKIQVQGLFVHVRQLADGKFNFTDMLGDTESEAPSSEPDTGDDSLPALTVRKFDFDAREIRYSNEAREEPYSTRYRKLAVDVQDLSTIIEEGKPYRISATGETGGTFLWEGTVSVPRAQSAGRLEITNVALRPVWRFVEPWVQFQLASGTLAITGDYRLDWSEDLAYQVDRGEVTISTVKIAPSNRDAIPDTSLELDALTIAGIDLNGPTRHLAIGNIDLGGFAVQGWSQGEQVSLVDMFATDFPANTGAGEEPVKQTEEDSAQAWTAEIGNVSVGASIDWHSEFTNPPLLSISPITARASNIKWPFTGQTAVELGLSINDAAGLSVDGALALAEGSGTINYQLSDLPLPWFNPNLPAALKARISDGRLKLAGQTELQAFIPHQIQGGGDISQFSGGVEGSEASLTSWDIVRWEGLAVNLDKRELTLDKLSINDYQGRLHIQKDGSINTQKIWQEEVGEEAQELAEDLSEDGAWKINIPAIIMTDSQIDFMDESLPIPFRTVVGDLKGEIFDLSTEPGASAQIKVRGSVDGYAPVRLSGTAAPFSSPPDLNLKLTFQGVDMALLSPYSGTYAGHTIDRGLLNLDLHYELENGHLEGQNQVLIDSLKFGENIESDKDLNLPLDLALALLMDLNGLIDLRVPISGDIDDPDFSLGSVISSAFLNLITKAVTAPFALLGALVDSDEDLQRINFNSGASELNDRAMQRLDTLAEAIAQRPSVNLVISGRLNPQADLEQLQAEALNTELVTAGLSVADLTDKSPAWEKAIHKRHLALAPAAENKAELSLTEEHDWLVAQMVISNDTLLRLIEGRAVAVKTYLVNEAGLAADRAVIDIPAPGDERHKFSGVELDVGS